MSSKDRFVLDVALRFAVSLTEFVLAGGPGAGASGVLIVFLLSSSSSSPCNSMDSINGAVLLALQRLFHCNFGRIGFQNLKNSGV